MKKKITLYLGMTGGFGSLSQTVPIIEHLDPDKYTIICNISHGAAEALKKLNYHFIEFPHIEAPVITTPKGRKWWDIDHYWGRFGYRDYNYLKKLIDTRLNILERYKPDLFMTQFCPPTEIMARIMNKPLICVTQSCMHPKGKNVSWWEKPKEEYPRVTEVVNSLLSRHGLSSIAKMEDLNQGDITFIPSFPEFDPVNDTNVNYIGPLVWESSNTISLDWRYSSFFKKPANPLIIVYTGHLYDSGGDSGILILNTVIQAFQNYNVNIIIATGFGQDIGTPTDSKKNILVTNWIPISNLISSCKLFIHHGGHGSCMTSIMNGIPSLIIPTFSEREFNARQMNELGIAKYILPEHLCPELLKELAMDCIHNNELNKNTQMWKNELRNRNYIGAKGAVKIIDEYAESLL